jgi:hypothetical protein
VSKISKEMLADIDRQYMNSLDVVEVVEASKLTRVEKMD